MSHHSMNRMKSMNLPLPGMQPQAPMMGKDPLIMMGKDLQLTTTRVNTLDVSLIGILISQDRMLELLTANPLSIQRMNQALTPTHLYLSMGR